MFRLLSRPLPACLRLRPLPTPVRAPAAASMSTSPPPPRSPVPPPPTRARPPSAPHSTDPPPPPSDPYPLPLSPEQSQAALRQEALPPRMDRPDEDVHTLRARLVYQTRKRGMLEGDLLLSTFAGEQLGGMTEGEMREFDRLLDEPDWDIYYWAVGKREPPERWAGTGLLEKLRVHARNEGKVVRRMPDLDVDAES